MRQIKELISNGFMKAAIILIKRLERTEQDHLLKDVIYKHFSNKEFDEAQKIKESFNVMFQVDEIILTINSYISLREFQTAKDIAEFFNVKLSDQCYVDNVEIIIDKNVSNGSFDKAKEAGQFIGRKLRDLELYEIIKNNLIGENESKTDYQEVFHLMKTKKKRKQAITLIINNLSDHSFMFVNNLKDEERTNALIFFSKANHYSNEYIVKAAQLLEGKERTDAYELAITEYVSLGNYSKAIKWAKLINRELSKNELETILYEADKDLNHVAFKKVAILLEREFTDDWLIKRIEGCLSIGQVHSAIELTALIKEDKQRKNKIEKVALNTVSGWHYAYISLDCLIETERIYAYEIMIKYLISVTRLKQIKDILKIINRELDKNELETLFTNAIKKGELSTADEVASILN